jgi:hypothetical protein
MNFRLKDVTGRMRKLDKGVEKIKKRKTRGQQVLFFLR